LAAGQAEYFSNLKERFANSSERRGESMAKEEKDNLNGSAGKPQSEEPKTLTTTAGRPVADN
jgi:hypothetical protein